MAWSADSRIASVTELIGIGAVCTALVLLALGLNFGFSISHVLWVFGTEGTLLVRVSFVLAALALFGFILLVAGDNGSSTN